MSVSRKRSRFTVTTFVAHRERWCRSCRRKLRVGQIAWSPYYGGGQYHLACEAVPARLPLAVPPADAVRCACGWYPVEGFDQCGRCTRLDVLPSAATA